MALAHSSFTDAGARIAGVSVDEPDRNAAMVAKLRLPFPLLSDPTGEKALRRHAVWDADERGGLARPSVIVVSPEGREVLRRTGRDYADRLHEREALAAVRDLGLPSTTQESPNPGNPRPGPEAYAVEVLPWYFRGARYSAKALGLRHPELEGETRAFKELMDHYRNVVNTIVSTTEAT